MSLLQKGLGVIRKSFGKNKEVVYHFDGLKYPLSTKDINSISFKAHISADMKDDANVDPLLEITVTNSNNPVGNTTMRASKKEVNIPLQLDKISSLRDGFEVTYKYIISDIKWVETNISQQKVIIKPALVDN